MNVLRLASLLSCLAVAASAADDLSTSPSALVRSQAGAAVHWSAWDAGLPARARAQDKPVYLFAGSQLNELSRATIRQSFGNADVAAYLNENFLCVIVDRDEQPALAAAIQYYLHSVRQQDGWPAHLWLTPDLQPYDGAAYLPPSEEWGKPSFLKVARQARESWTTDAKSCRARAADAIALMNSFPDLPPPDAAAPKLAQQLEDAATAWRGTADAANGGFGTAPKAVEPELIRFLLRRAPADRDLALSALRAAVRGAVRDPLDGGFFTRATDAAWHVPYFQKTLADQARVALACLEAAKAGGDAEFAAAARGALDYALARLALPGGGFAAAEDATRDETAAYYAWSKAEIDAALGAGAPAFEKAYGVEADGNISADDDPSARLKGRNLLRRVTAPGSPADEAALAAAAGKLRSIRDTRAAPVRVERANAAALGLLLEALARAGAELPEPRFTAAAGKLFGLLAKDWVAGDGAVRHEPEPSAAGAPVDYAAVALGARAWAGAGKHPEATALADTLLARLNHDFYDAAHGRFLATAATPPPGVFVRAPAYSDAPSAESLAVEAGLPADEAAAIVKTLAATFDPATPPPGDALLAAGH